MFRDKQVTAVVQMSNAGDLDQVIGSGLRVESIAWKIYFRSRVDRIG